MKEQKKRCSNFELLRIISMLMIITSHYFVHNGIQNATLPIGFNRFFAELMTLGQIGVVIFMLISGYFLGKNQSGLRLSKVVKLMLQVLFYSIGLFCVFVLIGKANASPLSIEKSFMPITFRTYWFITSYIIVYIFHPLFNRVLNHLDRRTYLRYIILSVVLFSLIRTLTGQTLGVGEVGVFFLYYAIGNYLRVYKDNFFAKRKNRLLIMCASILIVIASVIILDCTGVKSSVLTVLNQSNFLLSTNGSILAILIGVCIFATIGYAKEFSSKVINFFAKTTLGVYLIHDNLVVRPVLWGSIIGSAGYINSSFLVPHMLFAVVAIFLVCSLIEAVRIETIDKLYEKVIAKRIDLLQYNLIAEKKTKRR